MEFNEPLPGFNPTAGAPIALGTAEEWTANYRAEPLTDAETNGRKRINAYYFGNDLLASIQQQEGCVGLRFYMGLEKKDENGQKKEEPQLLVVGVDKDGYDIIPRQTAAGATVYADGIVGDGSQKCPVVCDPTSSLG
ncbi:hypothetical protein GCM10027346_11100 [Hymenobacter seoulensis]